MRRLTMDDAYAERIETALSMMFVGTELADVGTDEEDATVEVNVVETYTEAGILTRDKGLVLYLSDGTEVHLTINVGVPAKSGR